MNIPSSTATVRWMPIPRGTAGFGTPGGMQAVPDTSRTPEESQALAAKKEKLREASESFEAIFIRYLLHNMRSTMTEGGMYGSGIAGDIYGDIMDNALAESMSKRGVLGLADVIYRSTVRSIDPSEPPQIPE